MASTQLPPPAVGTPLHEWSQETAHAIAAPDTHNVPASYNASANPADADPTQTAHPVVFDPAAKVPAAPPVATATATHVAPETPGPDVPGAFPRNLSAGDDALPTLQQLQQHAAPVLGSIQEGLGKAAQNAVHYLPQSVKETVAPYLPEGTSVTANASHNDTVHKTSYPTTELLGAGTGESVGGVGALPGRAGESEIAKLPHERLADQTGNAAGAPGIAERAAGYLPQSVKDTVAPYLPAAATTASASEHDKTHTTSLPSTELTGAGTERVGGVGALPGRAGESEVAKLPHERLADQTGNAAGAPGIAERAAGYLPQSVKDTVAPYLPGAATTASASEHDKTHTTSLPSTELTGAGSERVDGAGALPGRVNEAGVARVPDEHTGATSHATLAGNVAGARDYVAGTAAAAAAAVSHGTNQAKDAVTGNTGAGALVTTSTAVAPHPTQSLPTTEHDGARPGDHIGGVGPLPGAVGESGVAVLPDERNATAAPAKEREGVKASEHLAAAAAAPTTHAAAPTTHTATPTTHAAGTPAGAPASIPRDEKKTDTTTDKPHHDAKGLGNRGDGYGSDYHPAALHPAEGDYSDVKVGDGAGEKGAPSEKAAEGKPVSQPEGVKDGSDRKVHGGVPGDVGGGTMPVGDDHEGGVDSTDPKGKAGDEASPTKSKFMDKAKGFMHKIAHPKGSH